MAQRSRERTAAVADVGEIPAVVNPARRAACLDNLELFLATYFPDSTGLKPLSDDHRRVIARTQHCLMHGGRQLNVVYRGFAKTSISERAAIWAALNGYRHYILIFAASKENATDIIESIQSELEENDLLYEDFPEVCHPIRALDGKVQRCKSQTHHGERTRIAWKADRIVMPVIRWPTTHHWIDQETATCPSCEGPLLVPNDGSDAWLCPQCQKDEVAAQVKWKTAPSSRVIIRAKGITGASRGAKYLKRRPDMIILDDPQDDKSAISPLQVSKLLSLLRKSITKLVSHGSTLACIVNATMIAKYDAIDQLLADSSWQPERIPFVQQWPAAHDTLWLGEYASIRKTYDPSDPTARERAERAATAFYVEHRAEMDDGAVVSWEHCYNDTEVSAIQHAYNALIDDGEEAFDSEFQQNPQAEAKSLGALTTEMVQAKACGRPWRTVSRLSKWVTAHIDVHDDLLLYVVGESAADFTGSVVEVGAWPPQSRAYYAQRDARPTLREWLKQTTSTAVTAATSKQAVILAGIVALARELHGREYQRDDGTVCSIDSCLIDIGYVEDTVIQAIQTAGLGSWLKPARGVGIKSGDKPIMEWKVPNRDKGDNWIWTVEDGRRYRIIKFDSNKWKSRVRDGIRLAIGDAGSITIPGKPEECRLLAEHCSAEYPVETEGRGRKVEEWKAYPGRENHHLDNMVGWLVAASVLGAVLPGTGASRPRQQGPRLSLAEMKARARKH